MPTYYEALKKLLVFIALQILLMENYILVQLQVNMVLLKDGVII